MALATVTRADWIAYNGLSDGNGGTAALGMNVTTHTYLDTDKALIDFKTGATLPVTITMEVVGDGDANGDVYPDNGGNCDAGTDADGVFGGILDLTGGNELDSTTEHKAIIFNGLNPGMSYTITLTSNRANPAYTDRWSRVTIEDADAYVYAASAGVNKLSEESGEFCVGFNTVTGYVMKWTNISSGADGSFSIKTENAGYGGKGYAMMAFKLEEYSATSAAAPSPADGSLILDTWANLSWSPGYFTVSHDVYFGDNFDDVDAGAESTFQGNQASTMLLVGLPGFAYPDGLVPGTTYYWRIDEVNDTEPNSPWKGNVWSFSVPPKTAYWPEPADGEEAVGVDAPLTWTAGWGAKLHTVYFGETFDEVDNATGGLPQADATYTPGTLKMAKTYYWRVDEFDIVETHKGDIWSFTTEGAVGSPNPANGDEDVSQTPILSWVPGVFADTHEIYFGADAGSLELKASGNLGAESYEPAQLEWNTTYYWRVDEANNASADSPWTGPLWSFTTANFLIIDDMEAYNDLAPDDPATNRIFNAWIDGFGDPTNGSLVGYANPPFAEQSNVHSGNQSMPLEYDNAPGKSEATLTLTSNKDWTVNGVDTLTIWYRGNAANSAETMYVMLNGSANVDNDNPDAALAAGWTEWNIPLQAFADQGVNLANVASITVGLKSGSGGTGMIFVDDVRLYPPAP
jgi:hypothetical protein